MNRSTIIVDCQYGSTGKGLLAGYLASVNHPDLLCMAPSPNAGHTLVGEDGIPRVHKMLPLGITGTHAYSIYLGPGSVLDLDRLLEEYLDLPGRKPALFIHQNAAIVMDRHKWAESQGGTAPGSTRSGAGAALIDKIRRVPGTLLAREALQDHPLGTHPSVGVVTTARGREVLGRARVVQVEGCQGYGLSIQHGDYPYVTSRDVSTLQLLADCGIPYQAAREWEVVGSFRTYPIRVANRPESGEWSGPCWHDSEETTFDAIGQPQELTTVTQLPRRIFTWSTAQAADAVLQNGITKAFLNFAQYPPTWDDLERIYQSLNALVPVGYLGYGPKVSDVYRAHPTLRPPGEIRRIYERYRR